MTVKLKKIYRKENVLEAALDRIRWLFDEFDEICVSWSGGKDSTVTLQLVLQVAEERGRLPVKVMWIDQEAEWQSVVDFTRETFADPRIEPYWLQVPVKLFNAASSEQDWLYCWEPGVEWMRPKEPDSVHENAYRTDRFGELFNAFFKHHFDGPVANIGGVRTEESPSRFVGLTSQVTYKNETWGKKLDARRGQYTFYPLYDWTYRDIWKAIHEHGWKYCRVYDLQYQYGVRVCDMRVSNLHHETAVRSLFYLQEAERETWERLQKRLKGVHTVGQLKDDSLMARKLPWMFKTWAEYRDHLLKHLTTDEHREVFRKVFEKNDREFACLNERWTTRLHKAEISVILANDYHMTKMANAMNNPGAPYMTLRRFRTGADIPERKVDELRKAVEGPLESIREWDNGKRAERSSETAE